MPSPDLTPYIDLTFADDRAQAIFESARDLMTARIPGYTPRETDIEMILAEALALEVENSIYRLNFLPSAIFESLLKVFGIERFLGTPPTTTISFNVSTTEGRIIPAGTQAVLTTELGGITFSLDADLVILPGFNTASGAATGDLFTDDFNNTSSNVDLALLDAIPFVDLVRTGSPVINGQTAEEDETYFARGVTRFGRLNETLVSPNHFVLAAFSDSNVFRAFAIDNYDPAPLPTPTISSVTTATTGGTLAAGIKSYRVSAINAQGETLASAAGTVTTTGTTSTATVNWNLVTTPPNGGAVTGYRIYGRTPGSELLIASVGLVATYTDTGAVTPAGALPIRNTAITAGTPGAHAGYISVAVYGPTGPLSTAAKNTLLLTFEDAAAANLGVRVIDPTLTNVNVTATVRALPGFDPVFVRSDIETVLRGYLSAAEWPWSGTVRRNELIALIDTVLGVDFVESIAAPAADVILTGVAPLATAGTVTITVNLAV